MFIFFYKIVIISIIFICFRPTFVHNFIIRDSIEENISKLFASENLLNRWDDIKLSQLLKVFE